VDVGVGRAAYFRIGVREQGVVEAQALVDGLPPPFAPFAPLGGVLDEAVRGELSQDPRRTRGK
jgi:hypothetical protein